MKNTTNMIDRSKFRAWLTVISVASVSIFVAVVIYLVMVNVWRHASEVLLIIIALVIGFLGLSVAFLLGSFRMLRGELREERENSRDTAALVMRLATIGEQNARMMSKGMEQMIEGNELKLNRQRRLDKSIADTHNKFLREETSTEEVLTEAEAQRLTEDGWYNTKSKNN